MTPLAVKAIQGQGAVAPAKGETEAGVILQFAVRRRHFQFEREKNTRPRAQTQGR